MTSLGTPWHRSVLNNARFSGYRLRGRLFACPRSVLTRSRSFRSHSGNDRSRSAQSYCFRLSTGTPVICRLYFRPLPINRTYGSLKLTGAPRSSSRIVKDGEKTNVLPCGQALRKECLYRAHVSCLRISGIIKYSQASKLGITDTKPTHRTLE